jgi:hypothetical protein
MRVAMAMPRRAVTDPARRRQSALKLELYEQSRPQQAPSSGKSGTVPTFLLQTAATRDTPLSARCDATMHSICCWA